MSDLNITIADLEALAHQIETEDATERNRLHRLIRAYARILNIREPETFQAAALELSDEDGDCDNSYPPKTEAKDLNGPRMVCVEDQEHDEIATCAGFYHDWRAATKDPGLYIAPDGALIGCETSGSGRYGQFAAHPGNCEVMLSLHWRTLDINHVPMDSLTGAEQQLRDRAFPYVAAAARKN